MAKKAEVKIKREDCLRDPGAMNPHPDNPRIHPDAQLLALAENIRKKGFINPVVISRRADGTEILLAGHGRQQVAVKLGLKEVPAVVLHGLTEKEEREILVGDNLFAAASKWEKGGLNVLLRDLHTEGTDLVEIGALSVDLEKLMGEDDDDDAAGREETAASAIIRNKDAVFKPATEAGLPILDEKMLGDFVPDFVYASQKSFAAPAEKTAFSWGDIPPPDTTSDKKKEIAQSIAKDGVGLIHFFVHDRAFVQAVLEPTDFIRKVEAHRPRACVMTDFSTDVTRPPCQNLLAYYENLWVARQFAASGIPVIPHIRFLQEDWPVKEFYKALPRELPVCWFDLQSTISGVRLTGQAVTKKEGRRKNVEVAVRMLNDFLSEFKVGTAVIYGPRGKRAQELLDAADFPQDTKITLCPAWRQANQDDAATPFMTLEEAAKFGEAGE